MRRYNNEIHEFIKANVKGTTTKDLALMVEKKFKIPFSHNQMKAYKTNHKLRSETPKGNPKGCSLIFTKEIEDFIAENVKGLYNHELCDLINKKFKISYTPHQIKNYKRNHDLKSGLVGFREGTPSPNKGKKMSAEQYAKCAKSMFKKGNVPVNIRPVGSERKDTKDGYIHIKIAEPNVWKPKHVYIWEQKNGPIPKGYHVMFLDQNKENIVFENLVLVHKKESLILNRNKLLTKDALVNQTAINIAKLRKLVIDKRKQKNA